MRWGLQLAGLAAGVLVAAPAAFAHELACEKTVNGETWLELDKFPATLTYRLVVRNIHPESASEVLEAKDRLLDALYFEGFDTPFTIPYGDEVEKTFEVRLQHLDDCLELAGKDGREDAFIDNVFKVRWDDGTDSCRARVKCAENRRAGPRMTGGGSIFGSNATRTTHGFELHCNPNDPRQNLEVNWEGGNRFHLLDLTDADCLDTALDERPPAAGFDTFIGEGTGRYNGVDGATIEFTFTDDGEPGVDDTATMVIRDASGTIVREVSGTLEFGNHQAHRSTGRTFP